MKDIKVPLISGVQTLPFEEKICVILLYGSYMYTARVPDIAAFPGLGWVSCSPMSFSIERSCADSDLVLRQHENYIRKTGNKKMQILKKGQLCE